MDEASSLFPSFKTSSKHSLGGQRAKNRSRGGSSNVLLASFVKRKGSRSFGKQTARRSKSNRISKDSNHLVTLKKSSASEAYKAADSYPEVMKTVIERTLLKSAAVLSDFRKNTILQEETYSHSSPGRFSSFASARQKKARPWTGGTLGNDQGILARRKADISKLPQSIIDLLKKESNSSTSSKDAARKYHSKKMALRQGANLVQTGDHSIIKKHHRAPKITLVSAPLQAQNSSGVKPTTTNSLSKNISLNNNKTRYTRFNASVEIISNNVKDESVSVNMKNDKKPGSKFATAVKKTQKVLIGIDNGVAFVIGPKTKHPYFNSLGNPQEIRHDLNHSNRKWVFNIGNFLDSELSLTLFENILTIAGCRQPTLTFPDGQNAAESIQVPPDLDINNLRVYRAKETDEFLVLELLK